MTCAIEGCGRAVNARGWCKRHYEIWRRHGDPNHQARAFLGSGPKGESLPDRLIRKSVLTESGCREWSGWRDQGGYGRVYVGPRRMRPAHVIAWELEHGRSVPPGLVVRHQCDNPSCVEPTHLSIGTQADNVADMFARGRADRRGERNNSAKLTASDVRQIRSKRAAGQAISALSEEFGISKSQLKNIVNNKHWRNVS